MPGYIKYPANLVKSVPQPPGKGGDVNAIDRVAQPRADGARPEPGLAAGQQRAGRLAQDSVNLHRRLSKPSEHRDRRLRSARHHRRQHLLHHACPTRGFPQLRLRRPHALPERRRGQGVSRIWPICHRSAWPPMVFNNKIMAVPVAPAGSANVADPARPLGRPRKSRHHQNQQPRRVHGHLPNSSTTRTVHRWALGANKFAKWLTQVFGGAEQLARVGRQVHQRLRDARVQGAVAYHRDLWDAGLFHPGFAALTGSPAGRPVLRRRFVFSAHASWS